MNDKRYIFFQHSWKPSADMVVLTALDIVLEPWTGKCGTGDMYAELHVKPNEYKPALFRFSESGAKYWAAIKDTLVATSGLIHVKFRHSENYLDSGESFWTLEFCAGDTLCWRTALMPPTEFEQLTIPAYR